MRTLIVILSVLLSLECVAQETSKATSVSVRTAQTRYTHGVVSFQELRQSKLVRQSWDTSCGAAALSTLLTYHVGIPVTEYAIATTILRGGDPKRVRDRGGFSLLDLKRFVSVIGLEGDGFGSMNLADLEAKAAPAIVPIRSHNLDHFVVFRGRVGDRVLLGDPAFGNMTLPVEEFETVWRSRIAFYVQAKNSVTAGTEQFDKPSGLAIAAADLPVPNLAQVNRLLRGAGPVPAMRQLPLVARVK